MTCCQDHILTENIWFVWSKTLYSGDERRCYRCGTTTNEQPNSEDRATQPMEAGGWVSQKQFEYIPIYNYSSHPGVNIKSNYRANQAWASELVMQLCREIAEQLHRAVFMGIQSTSGSVYNSEIESLNNSSRKNTARAQTQFQFKQGWENTYLGSNKLLFGLVLLTCSVFRVELITCGFRE